MLFSLAKRFIGIFSWIFVQNQFLIIIIDNDCAVCLSDQVNAINVNW